MALLAAVLILLASGQLIHTQHAARIHDAQRTTRINELLTRIEPAYRQKCSSVFRGEGGASFSQAMQDWYVFHNLFPDRLEYGAGSYIDIGSNNATWISNTIFFDKCLGWKGICFEPQAKYHAGIKRSRGCKLVPQCVQGHAQTGGMVGSGGTARFVAGAAGGSAACTVASDALASQGFWPGMQVDLISIDIEGAEPDVLRCFPLDAFRVQAILIEVDKHDRDALALWFMRRGYALEQSFLHAPPWFKPGREMVLDHLYVRRRNPAVYPPGMQGLYARDDGATDTQPAEHDITPSCGLFAQHSGMYCHPWRHWLPHRSASTRAWRACGDTPARLPKM